MFPCIQLFLLNIQTYQDPKSIRLQPASVQSKRPQIVGFHSGQSTYNAYNHVQLGYLLQPKINLHGNIP